MQRDLQKVLHNTGSSKKSIVLSAGDWVVSSDLVVGKNITLKLQKGARISVASGSVLTVKGLLQAPVNSIFISTGEVVFDSDLKQKVYPQWWGARGDGIADDTSAIQKTINAAQNIYFPDGIYVLGKIDSGGNYLENKLVLLRSNITLSGNGKKSVLKLKDHLLDNPDDSSSNAHMMSGYDVSNIKITNLSFDMNGSNNLSPQGKIRNAMALFIRGGSNFFIANCLFKNCAGNNVIALGKNRKSKRNNSAHIVNNIFVNGGRYVGTPVENVNNKDFSFMYVEWDDSVIEGNTIQQEDVNIGMHNWSGGIEVHGSNAKVINNTIIGCDPAIYIAAAPEEISNIVITGNKFLKCLRGISFFLSAGNVKKVEINNNNIELTQSNLRRHGHCVGIEVPNGGSDKFDATHANAGYIDSLNIHNNNITNIFGLAYQCVGITMHSLKHAIIQHNNITGLSDVGISFLGSPWGSENVDIANNKILDCGIAANVGSHKTGIFIKQDGRSSVPPLVFYLRNIRIEDNVIGNAAGKNIGYSGITILNMADSNLENLLLTNNKFINVENELSDGHKKILQVNLLHTSVHYFP